MPRRDREHGARGIGLFRDQSPSVEAQKETRSQEGGPLATVGERVVAGDRYEVGRGQDADIGDVFVVKQVGRPGEGGFQKAFVTQTHSAAVKGDAAIM